MHPKSFVSNFWDAVHGSVRVDFFWGGEGCCLKKGVWGSVCREDCVYLWVKLKSCVMPLNEEYLKIGYDIIGSAFEVRNNSGIGFRERYYRDALAWELSQKGYAVEKEVPVAALYKGMEIGDAYRADIVVDGRVVIEVKAVSRIGDSEGRQLMTYLKLSSFKLGYLINFGANLFVTGRLDEGAPYEKGIYRVVNNI